LKQFPIVRSAWCAACLFISLSFQGFSQVVDSLVVVDPDSAYAALSETERRFSRNAVAGVQAAEGLEATLFASEPNVVNPINIDVDHRGSVWVCEAYNYRPAVNGKSELGMGDRILILEDKDGDGKADVTKVFYQGPEINAPLGIWVMGNKAVVSQSPYVWLFTDTNGDDKADTKEVLFKGIGGSQHDAGVHAFVFGPDGKFYFNFGNAGRQLVDGQDRPLLDKYERPIDFRQFTGKEWFSGASRILRKWRSWLKTSAMDGKWPWIAMERCGSRTRKSLAMAATGFRM
jgi:glucose/arabinose dehydrogenase